MTGDGSRWCPRCAGAKRPSDDICLACAITRDVKKVGRYVGRRDRKD